MPSTVPTLKHQKRVNQLLLEFCMELMQRAIEHDDSKFDPVEKDRLDEMQRIIDAEGPAPYGSEKYKARTALLGPMLTHHYRLNPHHPEHYENGVNGMTLADIVEMFCDWKAASERGEESAMNIEAACNRFNVSTQLQCIFENEAKRRGWRANP